MTIRIAIFGCTGQLGGTLAQRMPGAIEGSSVIRVPRSSADLTDPRAIVDFLDRAEPDLVINAAVLRSLDEAEANPELAFSVNARAPGIMAEWCARRGGGQGIPFVHFSSDYVFRGDCERWRLETDSCDPVNVYGQSKLAGERAVVEAGGRFLIFRASWFYHWTGDNFLRKILRAATRERSLRVVADQRGSPTCVAELAQAIREAIPKALRAREFPSGIYHICNAGEASRYELASEIVRIARQSGLKLALHEMLPISSDEYAPSPRRPLMSCLDTSKVRETFGIQMSHWTSRLEDCVRRTSDLP